MLFFRGQALTPEDQIDFASGLGRIVPAVNLKQVDGRTLIDEVRL